MSVAAERGRIDQLHLAAPGRERIIHPLRQIRPEEAVIRGIDPHHRYLRFPAERGEGADKGLLAVGRTDALPAGWDHPAAASRETDDGGKSRRRIDCQRDARETAR